MKTTIDLLDYAVLAAGSERKLAHELGLSHSALAVARSRGNLSPEIAALTASYAKQEVAYWVLKAVDESSRQAAAARLIRKAAEALKAGGAQLRI
jgi:hypothetical protein